MHTDPIQQKKFLTTLNELLLKNETSPLSSDHLAFLIASTIYEGSKRFESKDYLTSKVIALIQENSESTKELDLSSDFQNIKKNIVEPNYQELALGPVTFNHSDQSKVNEVSTPIKNEKITLPEKDILSKNYGKKDNQDIDLKLSTLEKEMTSRLKEYQQVLKNNTGRMSVQATNYYQDLVKALSTDLQELRQEQNQGSREDKINLYNRLSYEFHLEVKYNVNLTSQGITWSMDDLKALEGQLKLLPENFTTLNPKLKTIQIEKQQPGKGGYNSNGFISLEPGKSNIEWALIHEIGHNLDNENPQWKEFKALSEWQDMTSQFKDISGDKVNGRYDWRGATATYKKDGRTYKDGDTIDLNGDGKTDGVVQIQYGKVMVHDKGAEFINLHRYDIPYSESNPLDDFAETFKYFFVKPKKLKKQCPEKFQFMVDFAGYDPTQKPAKPLHKFL